jgi:hypothetical protein
MHSWRPAVGFWLGWEEAGWRIFFGFARVFVHAKARIWHAMGVRSGDSPELHGGWHSKVRTDGFARVTRPSFMPTGIRSRATPNSEPLELARFGGHG